MYSFVVDGEDGGCFSSVLAAFKYIYDNLNYNPKVYVVLIKNGQRYRVLRP
jgi:hypothetical protein